MIGETTSTAYTAANTSVTAGGAGDNSAVTGVIIDRAAYNYPQKMTVSFAYTATLAAGKSLFLKTVLVEHDDASNLGSAATLATLENGTGTAIATSAGGGTVTGTQKYNVWIGSAKRYIRLKFTPDMDATGTDTSAISVQVLMGGSYKAPAV